MKESTKDQIISIACGATAILISAAFIYIIIKGC